MKKTIFFLAGCALALTGCTSTEVQEEGVQSNAIGFQNVVGKESRAMDNNTLKHFYVYGYYTKAGSVTPVSVFDGTEVYKLDAVDATTNSQWKYDDTRYWVPDMTYYFYAYSCEDGAFATGKGEPVMSVEGTDVDTRALKINNFVCDSEHQHDLIFAESGAITAKETGNNKVPFTFKHILSRLNVVFSSEFAAGYEITVSNARLLYFANQGDYSHRPTPTWSDVRYTVSDQKDIAPVSFSIPADGNVCYAANGDTPAKNVTTGYVYAIPYNYPDGDNVRIAFTIEVKSENGETVLSRAMTGTWSPNWVMGTAYTYNIKITGTAAKLEPIVFETAESMDDWTPGTTNAVNMTFSAN